MDRDVFSYLNFLDSRVYIGVFISLLVVSLFPILRLGSVREVFESFWTSLSVILSDNIRRRTRHSSDRLLIGLWLLSNTILLSIFSRVLYYHLISGKPIDKIDSIEELFIKQDWKGSHISVIDLGFLNMVQNNQQGNQLPNVEVNPIFDVMMDTKLRKNIFESVLTDNKVIIANKLSAYYLLRKVQNEWTDFTSLYTEGIDYYVSTPQSSSMPFHLLYAESYFSEHHVMYLNRV